MEPNVVNSVYPEKRKGKNKRHVYNNLYQTALFIIICLIIVFVISSILLIVQKGVIGFFKYPELTVKYFLFGGYYDGAKYFAAGFMVINTIWVTFLALLIALPISIFTALFVTRMAPKRFQIILFTVIAILAAIPSVIYGAFAKSLLDTIIMSIFGTAPGSILTIVVMLAFMIMPTITLLTITSINSVDKKLEESSLALGATKSQTSMNITLRAAKKGIMVAAILGVARALGEATAVSMVASQPNTGPTLGLFGNIRLLTSTMLQGFIELAPGTVQESSVYAMGMLLLITIALVFIALNFIEKSIDDEHRSQRSVKKIESKKQIYLKIEDDGYGSLSEYEQKQYVKYKAQESIYYDDFLNQKKYKQQSEISYNKTIKNQENKYKKNVSVFEWSLTFAFTLIGIVLLLSILGFLFYGGFGVLSWDYISARGKWETIEYNGASITLYGLSTAIFGTIVVIVISLMIALPLGIVSGIYFAIFSKPDTKFEQVFNFFISMLVAIPSLIYGIIGLIVFVPLANFLGINSLAGGLIMAFVILPTIIKTTQEALTAIDPYQKQGSLALGATNLDTTHKVMLQQISPTIISAAILSIGRIMGESAIFIIIFGTSSASNDLDWIQNGGTTLATEIYKLTLLEVIPWDYVKAISIVIIFLILSISLLANYIKEKKKIESFVFGFALLFILISIFTALFWLFAISLIVAIFGGIIFPLIYNWINKRNSLNLKIKNWYYDIKIK